MKIRDDLSYLPYPFLVSHILRVAPGDPALARRVLDACAIAPGQRRGGWIALARLQARELEELARRRRFSDVTELRGEWLPGVESADAILLAFRETARYLAAAENARNPYHRRGHLGRAGERLNALDNQLRADGLPEGPPFESGRQWFEMLEEAAGEHRILICIDEFERLESLFPGERRELLQLMGLFRATIQHRRKLRLLVSGAAPFDELDTIWDDHFVNLRELRVEHLDRQTSVDLLTQPIPAFPPQAIPPTVAERIFERTGGQPFLVQLYGSLLLNRLNDERRRESSMAAVEEQVLSEGQALYYFRHTYRSAPEPVRETMERLALGHDPGEIDSRTRRWLQRRCLVTEHGRPSVPVLFEWIREEA